MFTNVEKIAGAIVFGCIIALIILILVLTYTDDNKKSDRQQSYKCVGKGFGSGGGKQCVQADTSETEGSYSSMKECNLHCNNKLNLSAGRTQLDNGMLSQERLVTEGGRRGPHGTVL